MRSMRRLFLCTFAALTVGLPAWAQSWPTKTVTIIVSYPPGGDTDALARVFAEKLAARIG